MWASPCPAVLLRSRQSVHVVVAAFSSPRHIRLIDCCLFGVIWLPVLIGYFNALIYCTYGTLHFPFMVECGRVEGGISYFQLLPVRRRLAWILRNVLWMRPLLCSWVQVWTNLYEGGLQFTQWNKQTRNQTKWPTGQNRNQTENPFKLGRDGTVNITICQQSTTVITSIQHTVRLCDSVFNNKNPEEGSLLRSHPSKTKGKPISI